MLRADAERVKEILVNSALVFREKGYHGASMRDIGDAAGMNKGNLYYYFENKEELLFRILHSCIQELVEGIRAIDREELPAVEKLRQAVKHHVWFSAHREEVLAILVNETRFLSEEKRAQIDEISRKYTVTLKGILREGVERGEFRPLNAHLVSMAIIGMCNWMHTWYSPQGSRTPEEISEEFIRLLTDPIGPSTAEQG